MSVFARRIEAKCHQAGARIAETYLFAPSRPELIDSLGAWPAAAAAARLTPKFIKHDSQTVDYRPTNSLALRKHCTPVAVPHWGRRGGHRPLQIVASLPQI